MQMEEGVRYQRHATTTLQAEIYTLTHTHILEVQESILGGNKVI